MDSWQNIWTHIPCQSLYFPEPQVLAAGDTSGSFYSSLSQKDLSYLLQPFLFLILCLPGCILKQAVNIMQLLSACYAVAQHDADGKNK